jgi:hypothetical protein
MNPRVLPPLFLLLAAAVAVSAKTPFPTKKDDAKTTTSTHGKDAAKDTGKKDAAEVPLPVDPFTRIDTVLTGKDAEDLHAALTAAGSDAAVTKATAALAASTTKAQDATGSAKTAAVATVKADVKTLFNAEKAAILKANPKLAASIAKVESAKDTPPAK